MKNINVLLVALTAVFGLVTLSHGQNAQPRYALADGTEQYQPRVPSDEEMQLLKKDIRANRKQIIAANMNLKSYGGRTGPGLA